MKTLFYLFRRYKLASAFNLAGLVLAFTGSYILLTQIHFIGSFNHSIRDCENIRRVYIRGIMEEGVWNSTCSRFLADNFSQCPLVESVGYMREDGNVRFDKGGSMLTAPFYRISDDMLTTVNTELVDGTLDGSRAIDGGIIIPASLAEKYFGSVMVAGRSMRLAEEGGERHVVGVYKDFPSNCNFVNAVYASMGDENKGNYGNFNYDVYLHTKRGTNVDDIQATFKKSLGDVLAAEKNSSDEIKEFLGRLQFALLPLDESYLNGHDVVIDRGNQTVYYILQLSVILLLLVALINYANFSMAQAPVRLRSINTRKVMGESNLSLRLRLLSEGVLLCLGAFALSLLLAACICRWEYIGEYTLGSMAVTDNPDIVLTMAAVSILVGLCATAYSARYVTSFQPALVLKGNFGLNPGGRLLRQLLVGLQLVIAFVMVIFVAVIYCQRSYIYNSDYGFDKDEVLIANLSEVPPAEHAALRSELEKVGGIESVSFSFDVLGAGDRHMTWGRGETNAPYYFVAWPADWKILRTMGIDIIEGRDFKETDSDVYIINEAMKKKYPQIQIDKPLCDGDLPVLGVCRNFRASTVRVDCAEEAVAFVIFGERFADWDDQMRVLYIRTGAHTDKKALRQQVSRTLEAFCKGRATPDVKFLDDILEQTYADEMRFMAQIEASTLLAFLITVIGVFCLTMFETAYRRREIAIRKVMGSSVSELLSLFTRRYTVPLFVSFLIAAPIGYYLSEQWLHNFAGRTPIHWWIFPLSFVLVGGVVLATVIAQCGRVANLNPVESLKAE
ncbi:MAG: FtsX-like permease family protein [Alloprevotella sp.]